MFCQTGSITVGNRLLAEDERPMLDVVRRTSTFDEVKGGLDERDALFEARRCLSCGIRASECPCGAIGMVPETI